MAELKELTIGIDVKRCSECKYKNTNIFCKSEDQYLANIMRCQCFTDDEEMNHIKADEILINLLKRLGYVELVKAWYEVDK